MITRIRAALAGANAATLRRMYAGGRGNRTARAYARLWSWAFGHGLLPGER